MATAAELARTPNPVVAWKDEGGRHVGVVLEARGTSALIAWLGGPPWWEAVANLELATLEELKAAFLEEARNR